MGKVEHESQLLEHIQRLRRAGARTHGDPDIAAVRAALEADLGATVSRRMAARFLGISHTALERWISLGEIPVVATPSGRTEVPVSSLLDLREARDRIGDERPLAAVIHRNRLAADQLTFDSPDLDAAHGKASARGRGYHAALAARLRRSHVEEARYRVFRWRADELLDPRYADRWEAILDGTLPEIRRAITEPSADADDLRQNSPFAGMLSEPERRRVLKLAG